MNSKKPKQTKHGWLCIAARHCVQPQINKFRKDNGIKSDGKTHVDHAERNFIDLFSEWRGDRSIGLRKTRMGRMVRITFSNPDDVKEWREYHRKHAVLQAVSIEEHKKLTRERREQAKAVGVG